MRTKTSHILGIGVTLAVALAASVSRAEELPIVTGDKATLTGGITPVGDVDEFRLDLFPGDSASVKVKDAGPTRGLLSTLRLRAPSGAQIPVQVARQGSSRPSFSYTATEAGIHTVRLSGDPGGFGGAEGNYTFKVRVKRTKQGKTSLSDPAGGAFVVPIQVTDGALVDIKAKSKKGSFEIDGLFRPDGLAEPGFTDSLKGKLGTNVKSKKFPVSGGFGTYELRGTYDAGASVSVSAKVRPAGARNVRLDDAEPGFDPFLSPFPSSGIAGTLVTAVGRNLQRGNGSSVLDFSESFSDAGGGDFVLRFAAVDNSLLNVTVTSTGAGFDVTGLFGPEGRAENGLLGALNVAESRMSAKTLPTNPYKVTQGTGHYELRGVYDAGARVQVAVQVARGDGANPFELPHVWVGSIRIDPLVVENPFDQVLRFRVPEGLTPGTTYDIRVRNDDGQGAVAEDAFYFVPAPTVTSLSVTEAGPAGGRSLRLSGEDFRPGVVVIFDEAIVQPSFVLSNRIDVEVPPHEPGDVFPVVRDDLGQMATSPVAITYLDIGSNEITDVDPSIVQAIGGETVTVTGVDFGLDSELTLDGRPIEFERVSDTELRFVAPDKQGGTYELRVEDQYEQSSTFELLYVAFLDDSSSAIPAPLTQQNAIDGWRASRVVVGDVTGDDVPDLVLARAAVAFGTEADRSRIRIFEGDGAGGYTDATDGIPDVSSLDDWRARDVVLADVDDDDDLDILIVTDDELDDGDRSSLRLLLNDGSGTFTDATDDSMPAATSAGDHNQGLAISVADVDGVNGPDIILVHSSAFQETINESPPVEDPPPDDPPDPILVTYHYPATRVLLNDGQGVFTRSDASMPEVDGDSAQRFEGETVAAADVDGQNGVDFVITSDDVLPDPGNEGSYLRRAVLLLNDGTGVFTDESDAWLPTGTGAEYLQGDRLQFIDFDGTGGPDLVVTSDTRLVTPGTTTRPTTSALRIFTNGGSAFSATSGDLFPGPDDDDALQCNAAAFGDLNGDGELDVFLVSSQAPNVGEHGARVLVRVGDSFVRGSEGLPSALLSDDGRGRDVVLHDVDGDGDLDAVIVRDESNQTVRNTRVFVNPRLE